MSGSIILAAAGLLEGKRATSHWAALSALKAMGVKTVAMSALYWRRVPPKKNDADLAGVSAGIDAVTTEKFTEVKSTRPFWTRYLPSLPRSRE